MAIAYGRVLNALGVAWSAVGRGSRSATTLEAACGVKPALGGLERYLREQPSPTANCAIVALPIPQLATATQALTEAGIGRVLVEKPAGLTIAEIEGLARAVERSGAEVYVGYNRRFYASVGAARSLIAEDGGVTSFHMDFTERVDRIETGKQDRAVLANWFLANSSHVVDLAFFLCGEAAEGRGLAAGALTWHPAGAVFVGHGRTASGAPFTWHADWTSAGRWGVDIRTARRRLLLQPLEQLLVQDRGSLELSRYPLDDALDHRFKPGLYRQVDAFLGPAPAGLGLETIAAHARHVRSWSAMICPGQMHAADRQPHATAASAC